MNSGSRIKQARELLGLTQADLAEAAEISQSAIAQIESGASSPSVSTLKGIAAKTGFPLDFFLSYPATEMALGTLLFRSHATSSVRERTRAHRLAEVIFEFLESKFVDLERPPIRLVRSSKVPTEAARATRYLLGHAPDVPIPNLINSIERAGVVVIALPIPTEKVDAFSVWAGNLADQPVIGVITSKPTDRLRFSVAHELGHLVMHSPLRVPVQEAEQEAHRFASELLLPEVAMRKELTAPITLSSVAALKPRWRTSIQALIRRSHDLDIITERQYRYLFEQLSARGMRRDEGVPIAPELPRGLRKLVEVLYGPDVSSEQIASEMKMPKALVRNILESHSSAGDLANVRRPQALSHKHLQ